MYSVFGLLDGGSRDSHQPGELGCADTRQAQRVVFGRQPQLVYLRMDVSARSRTRWIKLWHRAEAARQAARTELMDHDAKARQPGGTCLRSCCQSAPRFVFLQQGFTVRVTRRGDL